MSLLQQLTEFVNQRPRLEWANYGDTYWMRQDQSKITRQLQDFRKMRAYLSGLQDSGVYIEHHIKEASEMAFSGRLTFTDSGIEYCTGQYWPMEYRAAACAVLASAIWSHEREYLERYATDYWWVDGDTMRKHLRKILGRGIASRWFN
jgi:hypothetical protein